MVPGASLFVVGHQQSGDVPSVCRRSNTRVLNAARSGFVEGEKGLVQQQCLNGQQGTQQADAGFLAAGERPGSLSA